MQNNSYFCCFGFDFEAASKDLNKLWANLGLFTGTFMLFIALSIALTRMFYWKPLAYEGAEPGPISAMNRILTNTLEQTFIFGCLLLAGIVHNPLNWPNSHFVQIVRLFILARCFYAFGFILGININIPVLRSLGFPGTLICHFIILLAFAGIDIFQKIAALPNIEL